LIYFGSRFYDPEIGRFINQDPAKAGPNWYAYCNNNSLRYVDPTVNDGEDFEEFDVEIEAEIRGMEAEIAYMAESFQVSLQAGEIGGEDFSQILEESSSFACQDLNIENSTEISVAPKSEINLSNQISQTAIRVCFKTVLNQCTSSFLITLPFFIN